MVRYEEQRPMVRITYQHVRQEDPSYEVKNLVCCPCRLEAMSPFKANYLTDWTGSGVSFRVGCTNLRTSYIHPCPRISQAEESCNTNLSADPRI